MKQALLTLKASGLTICYPNRKTVEITIIANYLNMRNSLTGQVVKIYYHAITILTLIDMTDRP